MRKHGVLAGVLATAALAAGLVVSGTAEAAAACTFYVSASGSDGNAGTSPDRPWATLERARDHIRQHELNKDMQADLAGRILRQVAVARRESAGAFPARP